LRHLDFEAVTPVTTRGQIVAHIGRLNCEALRLSL
jgi:hypothetical protein